MNRKGNNVAGGGLAARIDDWSKLKGGSPSGPNNYKIQGDTFRKPGSQNFRKGGRGKA